MKGVTKYQLEVLGLISQINKKSGQFADLDQILNAVSWAPSKESFQFVVRAIITKGLAEKMPMEVRRNRSRVCYRLTRSGILTLDPRAVFEPVAESEEAVKPKSAVADFVDTFFPGIPDTSVAEKELIED
jgi:hypothetical protein